MPATSEATDRRSAKETRAQRFRFKGEPTKRDRPAVRFGPYLLERRLAVGGMAEVFLGRIEGPSNFQKRLAIKRILPHLSGDDRFVKMFIDEARLAARFDHMNLVQAYELTRVDGQFCLAMEYVAGADLTSVITRSKNYPAGVPLHIATYVTAGVASGLHYAHELTSASGDPLRVVHRDVSPSNIMVTKHGDVKLLDFGIAKHEDRCQVTQANGLKGKLSYMSPEQLRRRPLDRRSDIFSLGVVFYEILTGESPLAGSSDFELMRAAHDGIYRPVRELRPDVPARLERVINTMMAVDPEQRFANASEVRDALDRVAGDVGSSDPASVVAYLKSLFDGDDLDLPPLFEHDAVAVTGELSDPTRNILPGELEKILAQQSTERLAIVSRRDRTDLFVEVGRLGGAAYGAALRAAAWCKRRFAEQSLVLRFGAGAALAASIALLWLPLGDSGKADASRAGTAQAATTSVHVASDPPGARLFVNGEARAGRTPMIVAHLDSGREHELRLEKDGYATVVEHVQARSSAPMVLHVVLRPLESFDDDHDEVLGTRLDRSKSGVITVDSTPPTDVWFGGRPVGTTPLNLRVAGGTVALRLRNEQLGIDKAIEARVPVGRTVARNFVFRKGLVRLDVKPWADVYIGGRKVGSTPMAPMVLYEGTYHIKLHNPTLQRERVIEVEVEGGKTIKRIETL